MTPAPPCHVQKSASVPFDGPVSRTLFASTGVVMLSELNTMQTAVWQPVQPPFTVFRLLIASVNAKYSCPPPRSWSPDGGRARAGTTRAVFGPRAPMMYAPRPAPARPPPQSAQLAAFAVGAAPIASDPVRHVPAFLNCHQAGSVAEADPRSTTISSPDTCARPAAPSWNVPTSTLLPVFTLQAKFRFSVPPSPIHSVHRMPTPAADATVAVIARSRPHSRVTLFIVCLRDLFTERG